MQYDDRVSPRQREFMEFMKAYEEREGRPPTFKEIAIGLKISSKGSISAMMDTLERMGYVDKANGTLRGTHVRSPVPLSKHGG